jgi:hypothetical protein
MSCIYFQSFMKIIQAPGGASPPRRILSRFKHRCWLFSWEVFSFPRSGLPTESKLRADIEQNCTENRKYLAEYISRQCCESGSDLIRNFLARFDQDPRVRGTVPFLT